MVQFSLLGSGSSGNAMLVKSSSAKILIDSGLSFRQLQARAAAVGESLEGLSAVFITHEHADHVLSLGTLTRRLGVPAFMTRGTYERLPRQVGQVPRVELFEAGDATRVDGMTVTSFSVSHDAADPVSYVVETGGARLGLAADLGHVSHLVRQRLAGCHGLILESNYCPDMLRNGMYPPAIQQRIRGRLGHLSNRDACSLLKSLLHDALHLVVLVHISDNNNTHRLAFDTVSRVLNGCRAELFVAAKDQPTRLFELGCA